MLNRCSGADPGEVKWVNFHPPFSEPPSFFFSYLSNIDLEHLNQALVLLHYYKNSPPISKSWIRAWCSSSFVSSCFVSFAIVFIIVVLLKPEKGFVVLTSFSKDTRLYMK